MIFTGENACHYVDFKKVELKNNDALILTKGQVHSFGKKENYQGYLILFNDEFLIKHLSHSATQQLDLVRPFHLRSPKYSIDIILMNMVAEMSDLWERQDQAYFEDLFAIELVKVLFHFQTQESNRNNGLNKNGNYPRNRQLFFEFNAKIQASIPLSRNAQFYADEMAITYKVLNSVTKEITGLTAKEYIDQLVILEAKRLIVTNNASILETAIASGFDDATNFNKYFKKQTGYTPGQFKSKFHLGQD
jgi:AraC-like DNA-binding protein